MTGVQTCALRSRSVALSLEIADHTGTLHDEKISDILSKVGSNAASKLGAVIRQV